MERYVLALLGDAAGAEFKEKPGGGGTSRTTVEPQNQRGRLWVRAGLEEPVKVMLAEMLLYAQ